MRTSAFLTLATLSFASAVGRAGAEMPDGIYVRIIPYTTAMKLGWNPPDYNAQDILRMIEELKPDVLNRFIAHKPTPDQEIPVAKGCPPMNYLQFVQAALKAGAPGCMLTPKVHLNHIYKDEYRIEAARQLRDLPVTPRMTALDLDCYFEAGGEADHRRLLQMFKDMGWTDLGFNPGTVRTAYGFGSYCMPCLSKRTWEVNEEHLDKWRAAGYKTLLLHIDYPPAITEYMKLSPDRQADIIKAIRPLQRKLGFRFIYPVLYAGYDANRIVTSPDGPYKGATILQVIKQMIQLDRQEAATRQPDADKRKDR